MEREREREIEIDRSSTFNLSVSCHEPHKQPLWYVGRYIYVYIEREREGGKGGGRERERWWMVCYVWMLRHISRHEGERERGGSL